MINLQFEGLDEAIEYLDNIDVPEELSVGLDDLLTDTARFAASITPVRTGAMRNAWEFDIQDLTGVLRISPMAINPQSGERVVDYAGIVSERLGLEVNILNHSDRIAAEVSEEMFSGI